MNERERREALKRKIEGDIVKHLVEEGDMEIVRPPTDDELKKKKSPYQKKRPESM